MITQTMAAILGPLFIILGLSLAIDPKRIKAADKLLLKKDDELYWAGFIALLLGLIMIQVHNIWYGVLEAVISFLGWLITLKGVMIILFPKFVKTLYKEWFEKMPTERYVVMGMLLVFFGAVLVAMGF